MNHPDEELRKAVALFRYGLIADVLRVPLGSREIRRALHEKAQRTYTIPATRRTRVAVETMRDWLSLYRTGGFEALYPKTRADRGQPRRLPPEVAELLVALKTEQPALSVNALIGVARERGVDHPLAPSTVHRLLAREGLLDKRPGDPVATDRRRFAFRDAGELWMSDVMHGPKVSDGRKRRKTYLIAFIDDATRVIPFAAFAHSENTTTFLPVFKQAIARRGLPARLFVDNGANFRSQQLALVCAKLSIALIHARPYQPAGKGKIERWFRTLRAAWLYRAIRAEITRRVCEAKQLPILVIDEAQHLRNDVLEDLRLLTNFAMDSENRLCLLLVGLTELRRRLAMAVHESLSQRLIVRHHLNGLDRDELDHYLSHRLRLAGCELPLFEPCAVEALFQSTRGLPRLINRIAHYALTAAALGNARTVTAEHLEHAVAELRL